MMKKREVEEIACCGIKLPCEEDDVDQGPSNICWNKLKMPNAVNLLGKLIWKMPDERKSPEIS